MNTQEFCKRYLINYTINPYNTIDVNGDVNLYQKLGNMKKLPVKFGKVSGYFYCERNNLTTLEGFPYYIGNRFWCNENKLISLEYCPKYIGGNVWCDNLTHHILGNVQGYIFCDKQRIVI